MLEIQQQTVINPVNSNISPSYLTTHEFYLAAEDPTGVEYHHPNGTVARYVHNDETFDIRTYGNEIFTGQFKNKQHCDSVLQWI